jgi:hypothetical protein
MASRNVAPVESPVLLPNSEQRLRTVRRRLGALLALYWSCLAIAIAVERGQWRWATELSVAWPLPPGEAIVAVLGGAPLGYFLAFARRSTRTIPASVAVGGAFAALLAIVRGLGGAQLYPLAIALGAVSAGAGAMGFLSVARRLRARAINDASVLAPDLPLVGGVYLTAPVAWLAAGNVATAGNAGAMWPILPLILYGATLLGSARASRGAAGGHVAVTAFATALWALCATAPLLAVAPALTAAVVAGAALFAAMHPALLGMAARDRRVEGPALRRALPLLALYLALAALSPLAAARAGRVGAWDVWASVHAASTVWSWAEQAAALVVVGYAGAELGGRREERGGPAWRRVAPWLAGIAALVAIPRTAAIGGPVERVVSTLALGTALGLVAARAGCWLYDLHRRHARAHAREGEGIRAISPLRPRRPARASTRWSARHPVRAALPASTSGVRG